MIRTLLISAILCSMAHAASDGPGQQGDLLSCSQIMGDSKTRTARNRAQKRFNRIFSTRQDWSSMSRWAEAEKAASEEGYLPQDLYNVLLDAPGGRSNADHYAIAMIMPRLAKEYGDGVFRLDIEGLFALDALGRHLTRLKADFDPSPEPLKKMIAKARVEIDGILKNKTECPRARTCLDLFAKELGLVRSGPRIKTRHTEKIKRKITPSHAANDAEYVKIIKFLLEQAMSRNRKVDVRLSQKVAESNVKVVALATLYLEKSGVAHHIIQGFPTKADEYIVIAPGTRSKLNRIAAKVQERFDIELAYKPAGNIDAIGSFDMEEKQVLLDDQTILNLQMGDNRTPIHELEHGILNDDLINQVDGYAYGKAKVDGNGLLPGGEPYTFTYSTFITFDEAERKFNDVRHGVRKLIDKISDSPSEALHLSDALHLSEVFYDARHVINRVKEIAKQAKIGVESGNTAYVADEYGHVTVWIQLKNGSHSYRVDLPLLGSEGVRDLRNKERALQLLNARASMTQEMEDQLDTAEVLFEKIAHGQESAEQQVVKLEAVKRVLSLKKVK